jgi:hypothetical protein
METEMKRKMKFGLALFFTVFVAPVWAHHAAEGIISYDVWNMIDENLEATESPHLDIDFEDIMGSMRISSDPDSNSMLLITSIEGTETEILDYADELVNVLADPDENSNVPSGADSNGNFGSLSWGTMELDDGTWVLFLIEPIGAENAAENGDSNQNGQRAGS